MAHILQLSDGTTTVDFIGSSGTSWCLIEDGGLSIGMPRSTILRSGGYIGYSGTTANSVSYDNRNIDITFEVVGGDIDDIIDNVTSIGRLLRQATYSLSRPGDVKTVYLKYQIDSLTNPVYFDVVYGELSLPDNIMSVEALNWKKTSTQETIKGFLLSLECKPFARGAEVLVASGTVNNTDDVYYDNYVTVSAASVKGDVPGPVRILIEGNTSDSGVRNPVWVGVKQYYTSYVVKWEAENTDYTTFSGSLTSKSTAYSGGTDATGGYAVNYSISSSTEVNLLRESLGVGQALYNKGNVRVLAVGSFSNECSYRLANTNPDGATFTYYPARRPEQDYHATNNYIFDLGVIERVPQDFKNGEIPYGNYVYLTATPDDSGTKNIRIDALFMFPADDYCYRKLELLGANGPSTDNNYLEDDGIHDWVRWTDSTSHVSQSGIGHGLPIHLEPGVPAAIYFLVEVAGLYVPSKATPVYVYHTPYYLNIRGTE